MEIANFYWDGELSIFQKSSLASFLKKNFLVNLWTYSKTMNAPNGVNVMDAREILSEDWIGKYTFDDSRKSEAKNIYALFSDLFRAKVVEITSGWWFDLDCFCLKDAESFNGLKKDRQIIIGKESIKLVNATVLYFTSYDLAKQYSNFLFNIVETSTTRQWGFTGPTALTKFVNDKNIFNQALDMKTFYPIPYSQYGLAYDTNELQYCRNMTKDSYVYHWWSSMNSGGEQLVPDSNSFLSELFKTVEDTI